MGGTRIVKISRGCNRVRRGNVNRQRRNDLVHDLGCLVLHVQGCVRVDGEGYVGVGPPQDPPEIRPQAASGETAGIVALVMAGQIPAPPQRRLCKPASQPESRRQSSHRIVAVDPYMSTPGYRLRRDSQRFLG